MDGLKINHKMMNGWHWLLLEGHVDDSTFQDLENAITEIAADGTVKIKLDLKKVDSINAAGLGLLMAIYRHLKQQGSDMQIINFRDSGGDEDTASVLAPL